MNEPLSQGTFRLDAEAASEERAQPLSRLQKLEKALQRALKAGKDVPEAFAEYSAEAFARGDLVAQAVDFLLRSFEDREADLARLVRVPDLVIELAHGGAALTATVAAQWSAAGDVARLSHLAELVRNAHVQMKSPNAIDVMLALAGSLGVMRPSRARSLLALAAPRAAGDDHDQALAQARQWVAVGDVVEEMTTEERQFWDERLRQRNRRWQWETVDERRALARLADRLEPSSPVANLFQAVVPGCWWDLFLKQHFEPPGTPAAEAPASAGPAPVETAPALPDAMPDAAAPREAATTAGARADLAIGAAPAPAMPRSFLKGWWGIFLLGVMAGMLLLKLIALFGGKTPAGASEAAPAAMPRPDGAKAGGDDREKGWAAAEIASLSDQLLDPTTLAAVREGKWSDFEAYLRGSTSRLPQDGDQYTVVLRLLHLRRPSDPETLRMLPRLIAQRGIDAALLELWENVAKEDGDLAEAIARVAGEVLSGMPEGLSEADRARLEALAKQ